MAKLVITGIPVSSGVAVGKAFFVNRSLRTRLPRQTVEATRVKMEIDRFNQALDQTEADLKEIRERIPEEFNEHKFILDSHLNILRDPKLTQTAIKYMEDLNLNAEWALEKSVMDMEKAFSVIKDAYIRERMQDVRAVAERVQSMLMGQGREERAIEGRVIIMAHDLTPADTIALDVNKIMGFATTKGGKTSHTGIMARTMDIPAVVGATDLEDSVDDGDLIILDGIAGKIMVQPSEEELADYWDLNYQFENYQRSIARGCQLPAETIDGYRVQVLANIELVEEVPQVIDNGAEGIGLYRTEYNYMSRGTLPSEDELYEEYRDLASIMSPRTVTLRTLDLGADKFITKFGDLEETNPALGLRAIRFCLKHRELFKTQLRAIVRASAVGNVRIMFPMISGLKEVRRAKALVAECQTELKNEGKEFNPEMSIGIMVELPSAVTIAEILAKEVDFFSIGTNDLIQYSLGIDRTNQNVSYLYQPLHPAIVRSIKHVVDSAHQAGIEVSLCGEVASDPYCVPILMGMQIDCISLSPQAVPGIKRIIRQASMEECKELLRMVLECRTVGRINTMVKETIFKRYPEELMFFSSLLDSDDLGG